MDFRLFYSLMSDSLQPSSFPPFLSGGTGLNLDSKRLYKLNNINRLTHFLRVHSSLSRFWCVLA